ncbi:MAG TPA: archease [Patescibacteria group bacterium]|nr:archease [Patescibacteria group bacterium]
MEPDTLPFEVLEHPADVGFLAYGRTIEELFANAALAMMSLGWELGAVGERERREIQAEGEDMESLLYDWLSAILALADTEGLILRRFQVNELARGLASGTAWGERYDKSRHRARTYIKAVTLHQFQVCQSDRGWRARVFLDV